ncbi:isopentenyl-diphosphate delta-isomerase [Tenggerimyces flavus]|nr:isopentenyl-diphosphate delta-isomerase [Tenggerimyces flavus]
MDAADRVLVTRRSLTKRTWPGVWSNSFCGHPAPGEPYEHAVHRRAADELGLVLLELRCVLPSFRYTATDPSGIVENEHCPVYVAKTASTPLADPDEVGELAWTTGDALLGLVQQTPWAITPWAALQVPLLAADFGPSDPVPDSRHPDRGVDPAAEAALR